TMDGMSKIILLIIAFQVVMGLFAKRKARQKAEEEEGLEGEEALLEAEDADDPRSLREEEAREQARRDAARAEAAREHARQEAARAEAKKKRLESLKRERMTESSRDDRGEHERTGSHPARPGKGNKAQEQAAQLGKDLLSQIAKELGLDLPQSPTPRPVPKPAMPTPESQGAKKPVPHAVMPSAAHSQRRTSPPEWETSSRRTRSAPPMESAVSASTGSLARESMLDAESIRRAIVLKTILDKPLSLKP